MYFINILLTWFGWEKEEQLYEDKEHKKRMFWLLFIVCIP